MAFVKSSASTSLFYYGGVEAQRAETICLMSQDQLEARHRPEACLSASGLTHSRPTPAPLHSAPFWVPTSSPPGLDGASEMLRQNEEGTRLLGAA